MSLNKKTCFQGPATHTCSKSTKGTLEKKCEICSKLTIRTPEQGLKFPWPFGPQFKNIKVNSLFFFLLLSIYLNLTLKNTKHGSVCLYKDNRVL